MPQRDEILLIAAILALDHYAIRIPSMLFTVAKEYNLVSSGDGEIETLRIIKRPNERS